MIYTSRAEDVIEGNGNEKLMAALVHCMFLTEGICRNCLGKSKSQEPAYLTVLSGCRQSSRSGTCFRQSCDPAPKGNDSPVK